MKKIPYGITDYKKLIEQDNYYIDKTMYLEKLENTADVIVYLKPRRFGKTLFTSMMSYYYDINYANEYDNLFKDTYIYNHATKNKNNYYILKFDFSGMTFDLNSQSIMNSFKERLYSGISSFLSRYNLSYEIKESLPPAETLSRFLSYYESLHLDKKIYLIIDEYDNFTNSILGNNLELFKDILGNTGFVKAFYARIKSYCGTIIDRVFITGVCSISLDAMTSGFNIATKITTDEMFNSMTALTHSEVKDLIHKVDGENEDKIYQEMVDNYDGYKFNGKCETVFNPTLTMYYLNNVQRLGHAPEQLLDSNIISSYKQIKNIISLGDYKEIIDDIYDNGIVASELRENFEFNKELDKSDIISLLFYFGYLTIDSQEFPGSYNYKIPNMVINKIYAKYYLNILSEYSIITKNTDVNNVIRSIINESKIDTLCEYVSLLLKQADNRIYIDLKEKDIQILMYSILSYSNAIDVRLEYPTNDNYIDIMIFKNNYVKDNILIELKYIKKKEYSDKIYNEKLNEAQKQITKYLEDKKVKVDKKYIVIFIGSDYKKVEV